MRVLNLARAEFRVDLSKQQTKRENDIPESLISRLAASFLKVKAIPQEVATATTGHFGRRSRLGSLRNVDGRLFPRKLRIDFLTFY
jgi:hypothetical protein